jgi:hypothetical protein
MIARYRHTKIIRGFDNRERVCETERFPIPEKNFSDGAWCMERLHDRPFQDFVAHETHRLIPVLSSAADPLQPIAKLRGCYFPNDFFRISVRAQRKKCENARIGSA